MSTINVLTPPSAVRLDAKVNRYPSKPSGKWDLLERSASIARYPITGDINRLTVPLSVNNVCLYAFQLPPARHLQLMMDVSRSIVLPVSQEVKVTRSRSLESLQERLECPRPRYSAIHVQAA